MASSGPNSGGTFANDASVGTHDWTNPADAASSNDIKAYVTFASSGITSHYLKATNFGFAIPTRATIDGILVEIEKMNTPDYPGVIDNSVKIVKGGAIQGDEKKLTGAWGTSDAYYSYGDATSLWGLAWTPADINSSTFGIVISCYKSDSWGNAQVDHIRITVYYTQNYLLSVRDGRHNLTSDSFVLGQEYYSWGIPRLALDDDGDWIYRKRQ